MGRLAQVLAFVRNTVSGAKVSDVKAELGGGDVVNSQHFAGIGDDSVPLAGDYVVVVPLPRQRGTAAVGYLDPSAVQSAGPGDKRIYSRDSGGGQVAQIWLKSDGSITVNNGSGAISIAPTGVINLNGVTIDASGNISAPGDVDVTGTVTADTVEADTIAADTSLTAAGLELVGHTHGGVTSGPSSTGPNQ